MQLKNTLNILLLGIISFWLLITLDNILIPLVLALFLVMLLQPILEFLNKRKFPNWLSVTIVSLLMLAMLFVFVLIIIQTAEQFAVSGADFLSRLNSKIYQIIQWINNTIGIHLYSSQVKSYLSNLIIGEKITDTISSTAKYIGIFASSLLLFAVYFILLLSGFSNHREFIMYVAGEGKGDRTLKIFESIMHSISSYVIIKTIINLTTGFFFWLICESFGIDFALFWGFLAFVLKFIPGIGSIVVTTLPILMGIIYLDLGANLLIYCLLLIGTEVILSNFIDPILMGNRLRLNTLTVILGLLFWGYIWGIAGMLLSVPLLVLMKIILEQFEDTVQFSRLMSAAGHAKKKKESDSLANEMDLNK
jgi:AI-2 transport protein TqsA